MRLALGAKTPLIGVFHGTVLRDRKEEWKMRLIYQSVVRCSDAFVYLCEFQAAYWRNRGLSPPNPLVIYNGIDTRRFNPQVVAAHRGAAREALGVGELDLVIGCNAMLRSEKNHVQLLQAVAALRQQGVPAVAALLGDGPQRAALETQAHVLGIAGHVRFLGRQSQVERFLAGFDIGALPSTSTETFSLGALEQMAIGLPMVMSDQGGAAEMLRDGVHGYVVPTGDLAALTAALGRLHDPVRRAEMGAAASINVLSNFDSVLMVDHYMRLMQKLVAPTTPSLKAAD
jgi:glycosyltransferase involved in cell wall biosynthesis